MKAAQERKLDEIRKAVAEKTTRWTEDAWILYPDELRELTAKGYVFAQSQDYGDDANTYHVRKTYR